MYESGLKEENFIRNAGRTRELNGLLREAGEICGYSVAEYDPINDRIIDFGFFVMCDNRTADPDLVKFTMYRGNASEFRPVFEKGYDHMLEFLDAESEACILIGHQE